MHSDMTVDEIIGHGMAALHQGNYDRAYHYLTIATQRDPFNEFAWGWLSEVSPDQEERRRSLQHVPAINPANQAARQRLADPNVTPTHVRTRVQHTAVTPLDSQRHRHWSDYLLFIIPAVLVVVGVALVVLAQGPKASLTSRQSSARACQASGEAPILTIQGYDTSAGRQTSITLWDKPADSSGVQGVVGNLSEGQEVRLLRRQGESIQVETSDCRRGWIGYDFTKELR